MCDQIFQGYHLVNQECILAPELVQLDLLVLDLPLQATSGMLRLSEAAVELRKGVAALRDVPGKALNDGIGLQSAKRLPHGLPPCEAAWHKALVSCRHPLLATQ